MRAAFFRVHRGHAFASSALMDPISKEFVARLESFAKEQRVLQRSDDKQLQIKPPEQLPVRNARTHPPWDRVLVSRAERAHGQGALGGLRAENFGMSARANPITSQN
jgi:hypothetical protein